MVELQRPTVQVEETVNRTVISCALHICVLLKNGKKKACVLRRPGQSFSAIHVGDTESMLKKVLWSDETKL